MLNPAGLRMLGYSTAMFWEPAALPILLDRENLRELVLATVISCKADC